MNLRPAPSPPDLVHQEQLTHLLFDAAPLVEHARPADLIDIIEQETGVAVALRAWGATAADRTFTQRQPSRALGTTARTATLATSDAARKTHAS